MSAHTGMHALQKTEALALASLLAGPCLYRMSIHTFPVQVLFASFGESEAFLIRVVGVSVRK